MLEHMGGVFTHLIGNSIAWLFSSVLINLLYLIFPNYLLLVTVFFGQASMKTWGILSQGNYICLTSSPLTLM